MHAKQSAQQPPEFLVVGRVVRPHGVRGALVIEELSSLIQSVTPNARILLGTPPVEVIVEELRPHRDRYLLTIRDCSSREQAEQYRGLEIQLSFDDVEPLPEGEFYYWQIIGLTVRTLDGQTLGEVVQILETGANDVYIVRSPDQKELLIPAIAQVVQQVDLDAGLLIVDLLPGLITD